MSPFSIGPTSLITQCSSNSNKLTRRINFKQKGFIIDGSTENVSFLICITATDLERLVIELKLQAVSAFKLDPLIWIWSVINLLDCLGVFLMIDLVALELPSPIKLFWVLEDPFENVLLFQKILIINML